jgi:hypothetical protein
LGSLARDPYFLVTGKLRESEPNEILGLMVSFLGLLKRIEKKIKKTKTKKQNKRSMNL